MPKDGKKQTLSRKRPVSCHFCRTRKLRCSRTAPCTNCVSRKLACDLEYPVAQPSSSFGDPDVIQRLQRLERFLLGDKSELQNKRSIGERLDNLSIQGQRTGAVADDGLRLLDELSVPLTFSQCSFVFHTCPIEQIATAPAYAVKGDASQTGSTQLSHCVWLPLYHDGHALLNKFMRVAQYLPYVTHLPSLPPVLDRAYSDIDQTSNMHPGHAILLLSIFSAAAYSWTKNDCIDGDFLTSMQAQASAVAWTRAIDVILEKAPESSKASMEAVQGLIIASFVAANVNGPKRFRQLSGVTIVLARQLGLHRIDHPSNSSSANSITAEVGRRMWWSICSSDWLMSTRNGMDEGVYSCHPRQMITKKPLNVNDDELFDGMPRNDRPSSEPTSMSFTVQMIRLAEISRGLVDRNPLMMANTGPLSLDAVMQIDTEMQDMINNMPAFYSMSSNTLSQTYGLSQTAADNVVLNGQLLYVLLYLHRCKLHLPYIMRPTDDPASYLPREICIRHARLFLQSKLWEENLDSDATRLMFTTLLVCVFLTCAVLLLDFAAKSPPTQSEESMADIVRAFGIIEKAKTDCDGADEVLDSLRLVLQKHSKSQGKPFSGLQAEDESIAGFHDEDKPSTGAKEPAEPIMDLSRHDESNKSGEVSLTGSTCIAGYSNIENEQIDAGHQASLMDGVEGFLPYWDDFLQNMQDGIEVDEFDWNGVFAELEDSFL